MKISDELVKYICAEIMKRLQNTEAAKAPVLLVGKRSDLGTLALASLEERFCLTEHLDWDSPIPCDAAILITKLNIQALVRVTEGDEGCTVEGRALLTALLNGQVAAALKGGIAWRAYQACAPKPLLARYAECERILESYGLKLVDEDKISETMASLITSQKAASGHKKNLMAKADETQNIFSFEAARSCQTAAVQKSGSRVLTECELMSICPPSGGFGQTLHLASRDILTPLAKDYILAMKIKVLK